jgi:hypothetical protein
MMAASLVSVGVAFGAGRLMGARGPRQSLQALVGVNASLLLLEFLFASSAPGVAPVLLYLHITALGGTLVSGYWSLINERFDPWTARRVVGRLGLGASLGAVTGGLLAWIVAGAISIETMLLVMVAINVVLLVALVRFSGQVLASPPARAAGASPLRTLRAVPYLRQLSLVVLIGAATEALLDYMLKARAAASFAPGPELMAFFAAFHTGASLLTLAAQTLATRPALEALGLAGTVALRPVAVTVASVAGVIDPRLWSAILCRGGHDVLTNSLFRSGYELLYTPLPEAEKRAAKPVVDVALDKLGAMLGGAGALAAVSLLDAPERALFVVTASLSLLVLGLTGPLHRGYVAALEGSLRAGRVRLDQEDVVDSTTRLTLAETRFTMGDSGSLHGEAVAGTNGAAGPLKAPEASDDPILRQIAGLRSGQATLVRRALRQTESHAALVPHVLPLLGRNDLYLDALRALRRMAPRITGQLVDALLDPDTDATVRRRLPRVLKGTATRRAVDGLLLGLESPSFDVRSQCALALATLTARAPELRVPSETVFASARRELESNGALPGSGATSEFAAAAALEHVFVLLSLVLEREPLRIASWVLRGEDAALKGTALEYLDNVLPSDLSMRLLASVGVARSSGRGRPRQEVVAELLRSDTRLTGARGSSRGRLLKPRG